MAEHSVDRVSGLSVSRSKAGACFSAAQKPIRIVLSGSEFTGVETAFEQSTIRKAQPAATLLSRTRPGELAMVLKVLMEIGSGILRSIPVEVRC